MSATNSECLELAQSGLKAFDVEANVANIKLVLETVEQTTTNMNTFAGNLEDAISQLSSQKDTLIEGWEGASKDAVVEHFPKLLSLFSEVPECLDSIANWAVSYTNTQVYNDNKTASAIESVLS